MRNLRFVCLFAVLSAICAAYADETVTEEQLSSIEEDVIDQSAASALDSLSDNSFSAEEPGQSGLDEASQARLKKLLGGNLDKNAGEIAALTENLSTEERELVFDSAKVFQGKAIGLNWAGFGAGSFYEHDILGGVIGVVADTIAISSVVCGCGAGVVTLFVVIIASIGDDQETINRYVGITCGLLFGGAGLWLANKIFGSIRPVFYTKERNAKLREVLGLSENTELALVPVIDPVEKNYGIVASLRF